MEQLQLAAVNHVQGSIRLPGSKSISNRTLLLAALASGTTDIVDVLASDDTTRMLEALKTLGVTLDNYAPNAWRVTGCNGNFPNKEADLFLGNAGTAFRPLTAALAFAGGTYVLSGVPRMHERPIADLVDALREAGANIEYLQNEGFPPLKISPASNHVNQAINIRGDVSSQFLTALLMALPLAKQNVTIQVIGELISKPYIEITLNLMAKFGVHVNRDGFAQFKVLTSSSYTSPKKIYVEGDASSASYFLAAGAIAGNVTVAGIDFNSIQGDVKFANELAALGVLVQSGQNTISASKPAKKIKGFTLDCNHIPDAAMTLAILALFADGTTKLTNIASWRVKETDRIAAMATELRKLGAVITEGADFIEITPPVAITPNAIIDTYDDHRMAMCFSLVALANVPITINDPNCVAKTFPNYFAEFKKLVS
jgi:3-phosphoshikimate 1-carboxyvinyltransferase